MSDEQPLERREQILDAALRVFAQRGFHQATIKQIAAEAGLKSPALIYWYFKDKREVFTAIAERFIPFRQISLSTDDLLELPPETVLPLMVKTLLHNFETPSMQLLVKMFIGEAARDPEIARYVERVQNTILHFLERYLTRQVELGRLRPHDTPSIIRFMMGGVIVRLLGGSLFPWLMEGLPPTDEYIDTIIATLLDGLRPTKKETE